MATLVFMWYMMGAIIRNLGCTAVLPQLNAINVFMWANDEVGMGWDCIIKLLWYLKRNDLYQTMTRQVEKQVSKFMSYQIQYIMSWDALHCSRLPAIYCCLSMMQYISGWWKQCNVLQDSPKSISSDVGYCFKPKLQAWSCSDPSYFSLRVQG